MATIRREIAIEAPAESVWDAVRDVGAVHERLARGFVTAGERHEQMAGRAGRAAWGVTRP